MSPVLTFTAALETAINHWLQNDDRSAQRLQGIQGQVIKFQIREFSQPLYFFTSAAGIQILTRYEGEADATIDTNIAGMLRSLFGNREDALFDGSIKVTGDTELGENFQNLLTEVDFDWEEQLSRVTGDVIAHSFGKIARSARGFITQNTRTLGLDITEYLQEEARLLPTRVEIKHLLDQVDDLRSDSDRLDARVNRLVQWLKTES